MDLRYEAFCFADPLFFDEQRGSATPEDTGFSQLLPVPGADWAEKDLGVWRMLVPRAAELPRQGWKIHVSVCPDNAERVFRKVYGYCRDARLAFKHLRSHPIVLAQNSKYAPRSASGKAMTLYPEDDGRLARTLDELSAELAGEPGPYILTDLRYGDGPLFVRYGAFTEQWVESGGARVLGITRPDGTTVPDDRGPTFSVPDWVEVPDCLTPHLRTRRSSGGGMPYRVLRSLHFSNGGGVYQAQRSSDGSEVVLKEARPHAGLDRAGVDAVTRLRTEHDMLTRLAGVPGVPEVYELFPVWEHEFLAMQHVPGRSLGSWLARHYPLTRHDAAPDDIAAYTRRALAVLDAVTTTVRGIHARGVVFGDLHPLNIMIDEDDTVRLVDFELACPVGSGERPALGAPGFRAPGDRTGTDIDEYALAALKLWLFLPLNTLLELSPAKLGELVEAVRARFPVPDGYGADILRVLAHRDTTAVPVPRTADRPHPVPAPVPGPASGSAASGDVSGAGVSGFDPADPDGEAVRKAVGTAILAAATPERSDRLFPGDIEQFRVGGACFAYGAAGVLHALDTAGLGRFPGYERWLRDVARREPVSRPGLLDGSHGIAYVLENFGYGDDADMVLARSAALVEQTREHSYASGLAGVGLTYLHFARTRSDAAHAARAERLGERVLDTLTAGPSGEAGDGDGAGRAGLCHGWSGPRAAVPAPARA
ncbi:class III lanthionine synthetase LanKC, partial [Saccharomonospora iraqiensis]|uniref:class III lanthionine synthetase LanKC n=1 Tax=Saccharomonospora iraqiensis TaxID=52698 RepID=UPI00022E1960